MLQFITGRVGCGKTTFLHKLIAQKVKEENSDVILIVPKQFTFESDIGILDVLGPKDGCRVEVLSFGRLAETVLKTCRGMTKPPLTDGANAVIMQLAIESVGDELSFFSRHRQSLAFVKKMLCEIAELKRCCISADELERAAHLLPEGILKKKTLETALIYRAYDAECEQSFYDQNDLFSHVYDILLESDFFDGKVVAIDDFHSFTAQEIRIISLMLKNAKSVFVTACTQNAGDADPSSPFAAVNQTVRRLKNEAAKHGVEVLEDLKLTSEKNGFETYLAPELKAVESNLYKNDFKPYEKSCEAVGLFFAPSVREECDRVAAKIRELLQSEKYRCRDIAVVYRNADPYEKEIRCSLKKFDVPIFEDKRQRIENEPLIIAVRSILEIFSSGFSTDNIMAYLKTGLCAMDTQLVATLENYALMWDLGSNDWKREWTENPDGFGFEMTDERKEQLDLLNEARRTVVEPLLGFCESMKGQGGKKSMELIYRFLIDNRFDENLKQYAIRLEESGNFELAKQQEQVWDILMNVLDQIALTLCNRCVKPKDLEEFFSLVVSVQTLGKLPDGFDEVYICSCERIATIMPKVVFVVGVNEGKFPKPHESSGIFGDFDRQKLRSVLPELKDDAIGSAMNERFMVYNALCSAREKLFVSWSLNDTASQPLQPSEIVDAIKKILPKVGVTNVLLEGEDYKLLSEKAAFELMSKHYKENDIREATLKSFFSSKPQYKSRLDAIERACEKKDFSFENPQTATELFGKNLKLSATRIETYETCPFKYFCASGVYAKPRQIAKLDPMQSGTLIHFVLEKLLSSYDGNSFLNADPDELSQKVDRLLDEYINTYMGGTKDKTQRFMYLYFRAKKVMAVLVQRLLAEFSQSDFEPCDFELEISPSSKVKPFRVELENGYIEFTGKIDRVDKMDKDGKRYIRVVDYKSGKKEFKLSDVLEGLNVQMLLYLICIMRTGQDYYGKDIVPAGVIYFPARFDPFDGERADDKKTQKEKMLVKGKTNGMILKNQTVIEGMSKDGASAFVPFEINQKTGRLKGNFVSLEQLGRLGKKLDEIMANMGNELHSGHVPARPVSGKNRTDTCEWCDFQSVCMRNEGVKVRRIEELNHGQCLEKLDGGEN